MSDTILVTAPEFAKSERIFRQAPGVQVVSVADDEASVAGAVREEKCRAVIVGVVPYVDPLYTALGATGGDEGAIIARFGVGCDSIDRNLAQQHRIVVTNTPGALDSSVAEHALWLMGGLARHVGVTHERMMRQQWQPQTGVELRGKTLGILGFGAIGKRVASIARFGFGMRVVAGDKASVAELERREGRSMAQVQRDYGLDSYTTDIAGMLPGVDVLSVHLPAIPATNRFVEASFLSKLKPNCLLVNTSRGSVVDEDDLYDALVDGRLAGAALDVYRQEPYQPASPDRDLRRLSRVLLTPHTGSNTVEANEAMARSALANVRAFLQRRMEALDRVG